MLSTAHLTAAVDKKRPLKKLQPKYIGPFTIIKIISSAAYKLDLPHTLQVHSVFHIFLLKPYYPSPAQFIDRIQSPPPPLPVASSPTPKYEVDCILDKRTFHHQIQYLVCWKGYPQHDATWELLTNPSNAQEAIMDFENSSHTPPLTSL